MGGHYGVLAATCWGSESDWPRNEKSDENEAAEHRRSHPIAPAAVRLLLPGKRDRNNVSLRAAASPGELELHIKHRRPAALIAVL